MRPTPLLLPLLLLAGCAMTADDALLTVAETSDYRATSRHADVVALMDALAERSPLAHRASMGATAEGRDIPLLILADPPVPDRDAARAAVADGRLLCFVFANIHAGEVCGKEASLILARELLGDPSEPTHAALLERLVIVLAPIYNGDGNERMAPDNRPGQIGPDAMGTRANAQGQDLNRDCMKLSSPEARAMARFLVDWDPHLIMDLHTTNGSLHRYALTWSPPLNPAGPAAPLALVRDRLLPEVTDSIRAETGLEMFAYGNFTRDRSRWETYSSLPRFGAQYHGLRGHLSILSEAYSKIPFAERVEATRVFVRACLAWTAEHADEVRDAFDAGRAETIARGRVRGERDAVGIRHALARAPEPATILAWVEADEPDADGHALSSGVPEDVVVEHWDHFEPTTFVERPLAYLVPAGYDELLALLDRHGIEHRPVPAAAHGDTVTVERYRLDGVDADQDGYLGHDTPDVSASAERLALALDPTWTVVPLDQPLGTLAVHLLEPEAEDSAAPQLLAEHLRPGASFPILRLVAGGQGLLAR